MSQHVAGGYHTPLRRGTQSSLQSTQESGKSPISMGSKFQQVAKELDRQNDNTMLMEALAKAMYNIWVAFEVLDEGQQAPNGWKKVTGHLVWM